MNRWRQAERRRLVAVSERIARRREWWEAQRDAATARVDALAAELAATDAAIAALAAEPPEVER